LFRRNESSVEKISAKKEKKTPTWQKLQDTKKVSVFLLIYRWLTLGLVLFLFAQARPHTAIEVSLLSAYRIFFLVLLYNLALTYFYIKTYRKDFFHVSLITVDCLIAGLLLYSTGGWRSPYYLYTFSPALTAALFFKERGAILSASALSLFYVLSHNFNGYTINKIIEMRVLDNYLVGILSYFLVAGFFAYPVMLLERLEGVRARLVKTKDMLSNTNTTYDIANKRLLVLQEIGVNLQSALDLKRVLDIVLNGITAGLGFDRATLGFVDEQDKVICDWMSSSSNLDDKKVFEEELKGLRVPLSKEGGVPAKCIIEKKPFNITKILGSPNENGLAASFNFSPFAVVPLIFKGEVAGVIEVDNAYSKRLISDNDIRILTALASQAAIAINQARLHEQLEKQVETLSSLHEVAGVISSKLEIKEVLNTVVDQVKSITGTGKTVLCLVEGRRKQFKLSEATMVVKGSRGEHPETWWEKPMEILAREVMRTMKPKVVPYEVTDESSSVSKREWLLCAPLVVKEKCIGVLSTINSLENPFTDNDIKILVILSRLAAVAIENAKLVAHAQRLVVSEERSRIAKEMHDGLAQSLFSIVLNLEAAIQQLTTDPKGTKERLIQLQKLASRDLKGVRQYIYDLQPSALEKFGLIEALRKRIEEITNMYHIPINYSVIRKRRPLPPAVEGCFYRVTQEALNNSIKHAEAKEISVKLSFGKDKVTLSVEDNGKGFDVKKVLSTVKSENKLGLMGMMERVNKIDGKCSTESQLGQGTKIRAMIPVL